MLLREFSFKDKRTGWELSPTVFDPLTLLVGASGVGKTKILNAIKVLLGLAYGASYNGIQWRAVFFDESSRDVVWEGETECVENGVEKNTTPYSRNEFPFSTERMLVGGKEIFSRKDRENTYYLDQKTIRLQDTRSLVSVLREDDVSLFRESLRRIYSSVDKMENYITDGIESSYMGERKPQTLINDDAFSFSQKLFICSVIFPEIFESLKDAFIGIFPFVQEIRFFNSGLVGPRMGSGTGEMKELQLKETGSDVWVPIGDFSSGMRKTLSLLAAIRLSPSGSIFLIDEFENSFGVNCISAITDRMLDESSRIQFILSSHHPYIINNVDPDNWRLVTRNKSVVSTRKVTEDFSRQSRHDAFMQLINMEPFTDGIVQ